MEVDCQAHRHVTFDDGVFWTALVVGSLRISRLLNHSIEAHLPSQMSFDISGGLPFLPETAAAVDLKASLQ